MDLLQSVLMGIVQGLSEFLPISSSGHLVFTSNFYKVFNSIDIVQHSNQEIFLDIMLHLGTLIAVLIYYRKEICEIINALFIGIRTKNYKTPKFLLGMYIIIGTFITVLIAYPLDSIAATLVFKPSFVGMLLIITGIILLLSERFSQKIQEKQKLTLKKSILIAIAQGLAALPGFSRSGLTISAGLFDGMDRKEAAQYSFLLSIPIILGASIFYPLITLDIKEVVSYNWLSIIVGTFVSGCVGYLCIKYFIKFIGKFSLSVFGYYCLAVGIITAIFFAII